MGDWKLEVFRMSLYMAFPVVLFYYFNQPQLFEEWVINTNRRCYPPEDPKIEKQYQNLVKSLQQKNHQEVLAELEAMKNKSQ